MKVVVIGGTGLIGSKVVAKLNQHGHEAIAAAPNTGVNTLTGEGLADALTGAQVVVDVANSPSFEDGPAWDFFTTATGNVLSAAESAGVSHIVALSVVGTDRLLDSGYFRAKAAQEELIKQAEIPFSIVRATQFYEFVGRIADSATDDDTVRISPALCQPMAADDVAIAVARTAVGQPVGDMPRRRRPRPVSTRRPCPRPAPRAGRHPPRRHRFASALLRRGSRRPHPDPRRHRDGVRHPLRGLAHRQRARSGPMRSCPPYAVRPRRTRISPTRFARETEPLLDVLMRGARRLTRSDVDAEDLLQDTLLHAYIGFHTFQEGTNLKAWLFRILYNRWVTTYRARQRRPAEVPIDKINERDLAGNAPHHVGEVAFGGGRDSGCVAGQRNQGCDGRPARGVPDRGVLRRRPGLHLRGNRGDAQHSDGHRHVAGVAWPQTAAHRVGSRSRTAHRLKHHLNHNEGGMTDVEEV